MQIYAFLFLFLFLIFISFMKAQDTKNIFEANKDIQFCGAGLLNYTIKIASVISKKHKLNPSRKLSTVFTPIRIILDTTYFEEQGNQLSNISDKVSMLKEAMTKAVDALKNILEVEDYGNDIFGDLNEDLFAYYNIYDWDPIFNDTSDIPADFIILAKFEDLPTGVLAAAMPVLLYKYTNRPIAGLLSVSTNPNFYSNTNSKEYFSIVFLHELTHALGFLESMYPYFPQGINNILMKKTIRGKLRTLIKTPKVVERARKYFIKIKRISIILILK